MEGVTKLFQIHQLVTVEWSLPTKVYPKKNHINPQL